MVKLEPFPRSLSRVIRAPSAAAIQRLMARPSPTPWVWVGSRRANSLNTSSWSWGAMPVPVSITLAAMYSAGPPSPSGERSSTCTAIFPTVVYLTAFESRLPRI
jgi:hypothetical protein